MNTHHNANKHAHRHKKNNARWHERQRASAREHREAEHTKTNTRKKARGINDPRTTPTTNETMPGSHMH